MIIRIEDDFDLEKIMVSGQCFRVRKMNTGAYRFITGSHILYIREMEPHMFACSCSEEEWDAVWHHYFDLDRDYRAVREKIRCENEFINHAVEMGKGIRVLLQDPWEMLVTFIISQRKSIPSIAACVEKIAKTAGVPIQAGMPDRSVKDTEEAGSGEVQNTVIGKGGSGEVQSAETGKGESGEAQNTETGKREFEEGQETEIVREESGEIKQTEEEIVYRFPTPEEILAAGEERIAACGLGYRLPYVMRAAEQALTIDFEALDQLSDEELFRTFTGFYGVGKKISNCVCLFAYGRVSRVPVDTWIGKVIREDCGGCDPFPGFGEVAGIIQQYVFYCARKDKRRPQ